MVKIFLISFLFIISFGASARAEDCHLAVSGATFLDNNWGTYAVFPGATVTLTQVGCVGGDYGPIENSIFSMYHGDRNGNGIENILLGTGVSSVSYTPTADSGDIFSFLFTTTKGTSPSGVSANMVTAKLPLAPTTASFGSCYYSPADAKYYLAVNLTGTDVDSGYTDLYSPGFIFKTIVDGNFSVDTSSENSLWDRATPLKYKGLAQIIPGEHNYKFGTVKYYLEPYPVPSSEFSESITVNATRENCPDLKPLSFKVTLDDGDNNLENNKQYPFDTCAPGDDPCKTKALTFKGGEFLSNDKVIVDFNSTSSFGDVDTAFIQRLAKGDDPGDPDPELMDPDSLFASAPPFQIEQAGDYEVTLKRNLGPNSSETLKKKFQAVDGITTFDPSKTYYQIRYPGYKMGYSRKRTISGKGCALSNVATIFQKNIPSTNLSPPALDRILVDAKLYAADADLSWQAATNLHNSLSTGVQLKFEPGAEKTAAEFEDMGRKRAYTVIEIPGTQALRGDDPATIDKCVHTSFVFTPPKKIIDPIPVCYQKLQHFILVNGMVKKAEPGIRVARVADPASLERQTVDHPFYKSHYRSNRKFLVKSELPNPADKKSFIQLLLPPDVRFRSLRINGRAIAKLKSNSNSGKIFDLPGAYTELLMSSNNEFSEGEEITGGLFLTIPEFEGGDYQVEVDSPYYYKGYAELKVFNEQGKLNSSRKFPITLDRGVFSTVAFSASSSGGEISSGAIAISSLKKMSGVTNKPPVVSVKGSVDFPSGGGFDLLANGLDVLLGEESQHINAASFLEQSGSYVFIEDKNASGVRRFVLRSNGEFELETSGWDIKSIYSGGREKIELNSGNSYLTGYILASNLVSPDVMDVRFDKEYYNVGDRAHLLVSSLKNEIPEASEFYLEAFVNSQPIRVDRKGDGYWSVTSSPLIHGENAFTFLLYVQDKQLAESLGAAITAKRSRIAVIEEEIRQETDTEKKEILENEKSRLLSDIVDLENRIKLGRTRVGEPYGKQINVD